MTTAASPVLDPAAVQQTTYWAVVEALLGTMPYVSRQGAGINRQRLDLPSAPGAEPVTGRAYPGRILARPEWHDAIRCIPAEPASDDLDWIIIQNEIAEQDDPILAIHNLYQRFNRRGGFLIATVPTVATHGEAGRRDGVQHATWDWWRAKFLKADGGTGFRSTMVWRSMVEFAVYESEHDWDIKETFIVELRPRTKQQAATEAGISLEEEGILAKAKNLYEKLAAIFPAMPHI